MAVWLSVRFLFLSLPQAFAEVYENAVKVNK